MHVTRRVYRSGEGEYLLNRQPCRLRDIRDVLAGTGITTEAYCIIEQGKVDALLQSSPRDRRVIFEEAAGISQFKAKKAAATRRLERVEQNLLRLSDIVDEVESRLRSVRSQAGKARRYRESTARLQQLRTEIGLVDWRALTKQIAARETQLGEVRGRVDEHTRRLQQSESELDRFGTTAGGRVICGCERSKPRLPPRASKLPPGRRRWKISRPGRPTCSKRWRESAVNWRPIRPAPMGRRPDS